MVEQENRIINGENVGNDNWGEMNWKEELQIFNSA